MTPDDAIELLNDINKRDPSVLPALVNYRVACNERLALHPTVQVGKAGDGKMEVGLLGIINGLFDVRWNGWGQIAVEATTDADGEVTRISKFRRTTDKDAGLRTEAS